MKAVRNIAVTLVSAALILETGCVNPDGTQNNTGTGALIGGAFGALAGAAAGGRHHGGQDALIGAAAGVVAGGLIGYMMDQQQQERLRQQSPQTLQTVQHNSQVAAQPAPPPPAAGQPAAPAASADAPTPLKVDDIKALTAAGVKPEAVIQAIKESKAPPYSDADIAIAQQANPPVDPSVIAFMKNPTT